MGEPIIKYTKSSVSSERKTLPRYLGSSRKSCHDICKYGGKHVFESRGESPISNSFSKSGSIREQGDKAKINFGKNTKRKPHADRLMSSSQSRHPSSTESMSGAIRKGKMQINLSDIRKDSGQVIEVDEKHIDVPISKGTDHYQAKKSNSASILPEQMNESLIAHKRSSKIHLSSKSSEVVSPKEMLFTGIEVLANSSTSNASETSYCATDKDMPFKDSGLIEVKGKITDVSAEVEPLAKASEEERADTCQSPRLRQKFESSLDVDKNHILGVSVANNGAKKIGSQLHVSFSERRNGSLRQVQPDDLQTSHLQKQKTKIHVSSKSAQRVQSYQKSQSVLDQEVSCKLSMSNESVDSCLTASEHTIFKNIRMLEVKEYNADRLTEKEFVAKSPRAQVRVHTDSRYPHNIESHTDVDEKHVTFTEPQVDKSADKRSCSISPFRSTEQRNAEVLKRHNQKIGKGVPSKPIQKAESSRKVSFVTEEDAMDKSSLSNASVDPCNIIMEPACKDIRILEIKEENVDLSAEEELSVSSTRKHKNASSPEATKELMTSSPLSNSLGDSSGVSNGEEFKDIVLSESKEARTTSLKPFSSSHRSHGMGILKPVNSKDKMPSALSPSLKAKSASTLTSDPNSKPLVTKAEVPRLDSGSKKLKGRIQITGKRDNAPSAATNIYLGSRNRNPKPTTDSLPSSHLNSDVGFKATKFKEDLSSANRRKSSISPSANSSYTKSVHKNVDDCHDYGIQKNVSQATPSSSSPSSRNGKPESRITNSVNKLQEKSARRRSVFHPQVKEDSPHKLRFRRGRVIGEPVENSTPTRLGFRQGTVVQTRDGRGGKLWKIHSRTRNFGKNHVTSGCTAPSVSLRHQDVQAKKEIQDYNQVIEQTANKLVESRKSKVKALVGAFETVISLQDAKSVVSR